MNMHIISSLKPWEENFEKAFCGQVPEFILAIVPKKRKVKIASPFMCFRSNDELRTLFQTCALADATNIATVINRLENIPDGTRLRLEFGEIEALLEIKGDGRNKKIRVLFTSKGSWRVDCFTLLPIRLVKSSVYPTWLNLSQLKLYKKLKQVRKRVHVAKV